MIQGRKFYQCWSSRPQADLLRLQESTAKAQAQELEAYKASTAKLQKAVQVSLRMHKTPPAALPCCFPIFWQFFRPLAGNSYGVLVVV